MSSTPRNVLAIGIIIPQHIDPEGRFIPEEKAKAEALGLSLDIYLVDANKPRSTILSELTKMLESKTYTGIAIGNGVRGNVELTTLFEDLVNLGIEKQPGAKFGFPVWPNLIVENFKRLL